MVLRIQHLMRYAPLFQHFADELGFFDADSTHQYRLTRLMRPNDLFDNGFEFALFGRIDDVVHILADERTVSRYLDDIKIINAYEFILLGLGGTRHTGELIIHSEVVLIGYRCKGLVLILDLDAFLRFERLMQALGIAPAYHKAACEFIDDEHLPILHDIVLITGEESVCAQRLLDIVVELGIIG